MKATAPIILAVPHEEMESFYSLACTVGGYIVFPAKKIDGKATINGARGLNWKIRDRIDLTLECIRRHYRGVESPLADVLARYRAYFMLFECFDGYVEFFLLQDMVTSTGSVSFMLPFDGFDSHPLPPDFRAYMAFRNAMMSFISARNGRMLAQTGGT